MEKKKKLLEDVTLYCLQLKPNEINYIHLLL